MTMPKPKSQGKTSRLKRADLNFISNYPLENIVAQLQHSADKNTDIQIVPIDDDVTLFRMERRNQGTITATVNGRMRRWAGNMTHIYCDGRSFDKRNWLRFALRYGTAALVGTPLILIGLGLLIGYPDWLNFLLVWSTVLLLIASMIVGLGYLPYVLVRNFMNVDTATAQYRAESKPAAKDQERLLHLLTDVIADNLPQSAPRLAQEDAIPLSDDEIRKLIENATLKFDKH